MSQDLERVPLGLGMNGFIVLINELSQSGYKCQIGGIRDAKVIEVTRPGSFTAYFNSWGDVFGFNESCASLVAMYEKEEAEREEEDSNNE